MTPIESCTVYFTSICNSKCKTCDLWKNTQREEFPLEDFKRLVDSPMMENAQYTLIGGEFTVYSNHREVVEYLNEKGKEYYLITNGILPERILSMLNDDIEIKNLSFSLDAVGSKHDRIRGSVGNYDKIVRTIDFIQRRYPYQNIRIGYTISNFNTREDLSAVVYFAHTRGIHVKYSVASNSEVLLSHGTVLPSDPLYPFEDLIPKKNMDEYLLMYRPWERGYDIKCGGIKKHITINYNKDVLLCENKLVTLGSLDNSSIEEVWESAKARHLIDVYSESCNECWMSCVRKADAKEYSRKEILESIWPKLGIS